MPSSPDPFGGPAITALGLSASRSVESGRLDRLISDPLARLFFNAADRKLPMRVDWPRPGEVVTDTERLHLHGSRYIGLRTRFYDDALLAAAHDEVRQGVLLGAGLDTRAFRLSLPGDFHLVELDHPALLDWKQTVLDAHGTAPICRRSQLSADLRDDWSARLTDCGFDPAQPSAWIAEGVFPYLAPTDQERLLVQIDRMAAPGSHLAFDQILGDLRAPDRLTSLSRRSELDMTALLAAGGNSDLAQTLCDCGWHVRERPVAEVAGFYGRDLADPFGPVGEHRAADEPPWLETAFLQADR